MARKARAHAVSGIYYVILKNDSTVFYDNEDCGNFLNILKGEKDNDFIEVYAYCLLPNQIHLVIKEGLSGVSKNVMRLSCRYVVGYNKRHSLNGEMFKGRFYSEPLEEDTQILAATKHVHRLPLLQGLGIDYENSSYASYFKKNAVLDTEPVCMMAGSIIDFKLYTERPTLSDEELINKIREMFKGISLKEIEALNEKQYKLLLKKIASIKDAEPSQVARVLGIDENEIPI